MSVLVVHGDGRLRIRARDHFEFRIRRVAREILVRINLDVGRMIDGQQFNSIQVNRFFQRLHKAEAKLAVLSNHRVTIDLDVLRWTGDVALVWSDPVSDDARAQHVADQLIVIPVPNEERRTRTAAAIDLQKFLLAFARNFDLVLKHSHGPKHANHVSLFGLSKSHNNVGGILAEIAGGSGDLKLLPIPAREYFDLGADGALVVVQSFQ